ncbi:hypothetical protein B0T21DRAFT_386349 [Apiosordaria backusii]|uniref:RRM domain-containing protein n=1 Tax=Apiosordaria backusii TaxID=314023 RepID=A0AA40DZJ8_9PEZI|nr:hypothetical protein B0T21DRAFT_386349 [Apiosordaria backusii]
MSEQSPEIVAAASLSPLSPKPISIQLQNNSVVPMLQDQAATTDTTGPNPADPHQSEPMAGIIMESSLKNADAPAPVSDTIVVAGDSSDFHDESDDSIDYGEEDETQEQLAAITDADADAAPDNDEYAKSFDSPVNPQSPSSEAGAGEPQPDVPEEEAAASNSMNDQVTSASAATQSQSNSPAVAHLSDRPRPPPSPSAAQPGEQPNSNGWPAPKPVENEPPTTTSGTPSPLSASASHPTSTMLPTPNPNKPAAAVDSAPAPGAPLSSTLQDEAAIQKLVDDITARATASGTSGDAPTPISAPLLTSGPHPSSLPPKPLISAQPHAYQPRGPNPNHPLTPTEGGLMHHHNNSNHGAYRHSYDPMESLAPAPGSAYGGHPPSQYPAQFQNPSQTNQYGSIPPGAWETFLAEEKRYTSEQNWDKFPEGTRVFVGNLSSERVSKQEVFAVFSKFGRLAQISMKSAYGFVQYHTVAEAQAALEACENMEFGGRKIHLEISRRQKKKAGDGRGHSPDRRGPRAMTNDRYDSNSQTRDAGWKKNDYRRSASPRRDGPRGFYPRDRDTGPISQDRRRSRSPPRRNRFGSELYRRRSPSPHHRRTPSDVDRLDIPRRYGNDVPDIQILLLQDVDRQFVNWVQNALHARGLRTNVMHLNPRFPRDTIVQRQVLEGVHAIIDLDHNSASQGKVNLQLFIRNGNNIRFDNYSALDPPIAAELVIREKPSAVVQAAPPPVAPPAAYPPRNYQPPAYQSNPVPPPPPAAAYQHYPPQPAPHLPQAAPVAVPPATAIPDLSKIDNDTLRTLLASLQPQAQQQAHPVAAPAPQMNINALLGSLQNAGGVAPPPPPPAPHYGAPPPQAGYYSGVPPPPSSGGQGGGAGVNNSAHIQSIMENLKRASGNR